MTILIYFFASLFVVISVLMLWAYRRLRHYGLFIMALTYGVSAGLAFSLTHWWPLIAGYGMVWILKLIGLDPDSDLLGRRRETKAGEE